MHMSAYNSFMEATKAPFISGMGKWWYIHNGIIQQYKDIY